MKVGNEGEVARRRGKSAACPNGQIPFANIADMQTREAVMKIGENVMAISRRVAELEAKIRTIEGGA